MISAPWWPLKVIQIWPPFGIGWKFKSVFTDCALLWKGSLWLILRWRIQIWHINFTICHLVAIKCIKVVILTRLTVKSAKELCYWNNSFSCSYKPNLGMGNPNLPTDNWYLPPGGCQRLFKCGRRQYCDSKYVSGLLGIRNTYFDIFLMINDQGNPKSHPENPLIWLLKNLILPKTPKNY